ncbi:MAG: hypothetical protein K2L35_07740, partial [Muribaculaceae bacterium]|nr:hypothetical protein [Muribaculaceae bacterium]
MFATSDIVVEIFILVNIDCRDGSFEESDILSALRLWRGISLRRQEGPFTVCHDPSWRNPGVSDCKLSDKISIEKIFTPKMHMFFLFVQVFHHFLLR